MNQDQRELLELAAYAMQQTGDRNFANYDVVEHAVCLELGYRRGAITSYWNPLEDKADAFDLQTKLRFNVQVSEASIVVSWNWNEYESATPIYEYPKATMDEDFNQTYYGHDEATMLALTRAAAAIGKQMKGNGE